MAKTFDLTNSPFSQFEKIKPVRSDGLLQTEMHLVIKHYPTEEFLLKEAMNEVNQEIRGVISRVFKKYQIDKPKDELMEL